MHPFLARISPPTPSLSSIRKAGKFMLAAAALSLVANANGQTEEIRERTMTMQKMGLELEIAYTTTGGSPARRKSNAVPGS